jgi:hypothetical protein
LVARRAAQDVREFLADYFSSHGCALECIPWKSDLLALDGDWEQCNVSSVVFLPETFAEYERSLSPDFTRKLDYAYRKLRAMGGIHADVSDAASALEFF